MNIYLPGNPYRSRQQKMHVSIGKSNIENDPPDASLHYTEIVQPNSLAAVSRNLIGIPVASLL